MRLYIVAMTYCHTVTLAHPGPPSSLVVYLVVPDWVSHIVLKTHHRWITLNWCPVAMVSYLSQVDQVDWVACGYGYKWTR